MFNEERFTVLRVSTETTDCEINSTYRYHDFRRSTLASLAMIFLLCFFSEKKSKAKKSLNKYEILGESRHSAFQEASYLCLNGNLEGVVVQKTFYAL